MHLEGYPRPFKVASLDKLHDTWTGSRDARRRNGAAGVDNITPGMFRGDIARNIAKLHSELISRDFEFRGLRPIPIPKTNGKIRIICVPTVGDRLVQRLLVEYLIDGDKLRIGNTVSYGFVRDRGGVRQAVKTAKRLRTQYPWAFKSDIASFFDQIDRDSLKADLMKHLRKSSTLPLLFSAIDCEIDDEGDHSTAAQIDSIGIVRGRGLRQGMPLSPILSNAVLREFDHFFERRRIKLVRYADDFVIFATTEKECQEYFPLVYDLLAKRKHQIPPIGPGSKTAIYSPNEPIEFLGFDIAQRKSGKGYIILAPERAFAAIKNDLQVKFMNFDVAFKNYKTLFRTIAKLNSMTNGFVNVYSLAKNYQALRSHAANCRAVTCRRLLIEVFGKEVLTHLNHQKLEFLSLSDAEIFSD